MNFKIFELNLLREQSSLKKQPCVLYIIKVQVLTPWMLRNKHLNM